MQLKKLWSIFLVLMILLFVLAFASISLDWPIKKYAWIQSGTSPTRVEPLHPSLFNNRIPPYDMV